MLDERSRLILEAVIRDYIESGEPVSSGSVFRRHKFGIKPAMIRSVLSRLTDQGFLNQPHHSAGRVPSDLGYEFFAARAIADARERLHESDKFLELLERGMWDDLVRDLSGYLGLATVAENFGQGIVRKRGLEELFRHLAINSKEEAVEVVKDFETIEDRLDKLERDVNEIGVYVGSKSPITKSEELSVVASRYETDDGPLLLLAIGPKRMNYEKVARVFKGLKEAKPNKTKKKK